MPKSLRSSNSPLAADFDAIYFDLDGVVYRGSAAVPGAVEAFGKLAGHRLAFLTNNANRSPEAVSAQLTELGIAASVEQVVTSAQAIGALMASELAPGSAVFVVGGPGLTEAMIANGLSPLSRRDGAAAVVQGYAPDVDWRKLAELSYAVESGLPWYVSNLDLTIPTADGVAPGNGALVETVRIATGAEPVVAGKPFAPLFAEANKRFAPTTPLMVGDRLDTDILGANRAQIPSLFVLTGVNTLTDVLFAAADHRPDFVAVDLAGLQHVHLAVEVVGRRSVCGSAEAEVSSGTLQLTRAGNSATESLRALLGLGWSLLDDSAGMFVLDGTIEL